MKAQIIDLFPLSVMTDQVLLPTNEKKEIINYIFKIEKETKNINKISGDAWVGDRKGYEYILKKPEMHNLAKLIGEKIKAYVEMLNLNTSKVQIFVQRSWATITRTNENIQMHSHDQSNISFAYYPLKPEKSGDISFFCQHHQNEIANGLFHQDAIQLNILNTINQRNAQTIDIDVKEDCIVIFPSKTKHATKPNLTQNEIKFSCDPILPLFLLKSFKGNMGP